MDDQLSHHGLRRAFIICTLTGMGFTLLSAVFHLSMFVAMSLSVISMGAYFWVFWDGGRPAELRKTFSESMYYQGFIMTITAIIIAMIHFDVGDEFSASAVIVQFGIAMITTLIGIFVHVIFKQFDASIETADVSIRAELQRSMTHFVNQTALMRKKLTEASEAVSITSQQLIEQNNTSERLYKENVKAINSAAQAGASEYSENIVKTLNSSISLVEKKLNSSSESLNTLSDAYKKQVAVVSTLTETQDSFNLKTEACKESLTGFSDGIILLKKSLISAIQELLKCHQQLVSTIKQSNEDSEVESLGDKVANLEEKVSSAIDKIINLSNSLEAGAETIAVCSNSWISNLTDINASISTSLDATERLRRPESGDNYEQ